MQELLGTRLVAKKRFDELVALVKQSEVGCVPLPRWGRFELRRLCPSCGRRVESRKIRISLSGLAVPVVGVVELFQCRCSYQCAVGRREFLE